MIGKNWLFFLLLKLLNSMLKIKESLNGKFELNFETFFVTNYKLINRDIME
jgi:hypothetical protein